MSFIRKHIYSVTLLLLFSLVCVNSATTYHSRKVRFADYEVQADGTFVYILKGIEQLHAKDGLKALGKVDVSGRRCELVRIAVRLGLLRPGRRKITVSSLLKPT